MELSDIYTKQNKNEILSDGNTIPNENTITSFFHFYMSNKNIYV